MFGLRSVGAVSSCFVVIFQMIRQVEGLGMTSKPVQEIQETATVTKSSEKPRFLLFPHVPTQTGSPFHNRRRGLGRPARRAKSGTAHRRALRTYSSAWSLPAPRSEPQAERCFFSGKLMEDQGRSGLSSFKHEHGRCAGKALVKWKIT